MDSDKEFLANIDQEIASLQQTVVRTVGAEKSEAQARLQRLRYMRTKITLQPDELSARWIH